MRQSTFFPIILGVVLAMGITTILDISGYAMVSALSLCPLFLLFWWWQGFSRSEIGFRWGRGKDHRLAAAYPLLVMTPLVLLAFAFGAVDFSGTNWNHFMINLFVGGLSTVIVAVVTEEGFFRGWLWAGLSRVGSSPKKVLVITSLVFAAWHIPAISLDTGFDLPAPYIPIYLVNATLMGLAWGLVRQASDSIVVASVCHGIWNGMAYSLFGFGGKPGALGIETWWIFSPENGVLGIVLNLAFVAWLWRRVFAAVEAPRPE